MKSKQIATILLLFSIFFVEKSISKQPNIVFFLIDDAGISDMSFSSKTWNPNDKPAFETPNIDNLAKDGQILTKYYTHFVCGPTRSALLTGRSANSLGNPFAMADSAGSLDPKYDTIADSLKTRGYSTHVIGKWGVDYPQCPEGYKYGTYEMFSVDSKDGLGPTERGFDTFYGLYGSGHNHYTKELVVPGNIDWHRLNQTHQIHYPEIDPEQDQYSTHLFTREALNIIDTWENNDEAHFLYQSYTAPHDPLQAPQEDIDSDQSDTSKTGEEELFVL